MSDVAEKDHTPEVTAFAADCEWTGAQSSDRDAWLAARRDYISASDVAAIMGEDSYRSALDVYADKALGPLVEERMGLDDPRFWGTVLEQTILGAVANHHGWQYRAGGYLLRSRTHPHLAATLDAEVDRGDGWRNFEGKTTRVARDWDEDSGSLPTRVLIQTQAQMLVTGAPSTIVFALLQTVKGLQPCMIEVHPSVEFQAIIIETTEEFRERVRTLSPPPADARSRRALERLHPRDQAQGAVMLGADALEWTAEYQEVSRQIAILSKRKGEIQNLLKQSIGDQSFGVLPEAVGNKTCWRWQRQERLGYTVEPSTSDVLLALKQAPRELFGLQLPAANKHNPALIPASETKALKPKSRRRSKR